MRSLSQSVFNGEDNAYRYATVVQGHCVLATNLPLEKKDSFGNKYLSCPDDTFCKTLSDDFEPYDEFIERIYQGNTQ